MLYEKSTKLPRFSTPTGMMFLLVYQMRQRIEFQKSRALMQALMSQQGAQDDNIKKVFDELKDAFFPFDKNQKASENKKMKNVLDYWIKQGPVVVEAQDDGSQKRKVASKLARGQRNLAEKQAQQQQGRTVGIEAFDKAKRRPRA